MLNLRATRQFKKDLRKAKRQGREIGTLQRVIDTLQRGGALDEKYRDHGLTGNWKDHRECHVAPDWLLIYKITDDELRLTRVGGHAELFG